MPTMIIISSQYYRVVAATISIRGRVNGITTRQVYHQGTGISFQVGTP